MKFLTSRTSFLNGYNSFRFFGSFCLDNALIIPSSLPCDMEDLRDRYSSLKASVSVGEGDSEMGILAHVSGIA